MKKLLFLLALTILFSCEKARDPDKCCTLCFVLGTEDDSNLCDPIIEATHRYVAEFCDSLQKAKVPDFIKANTRYDSVKHITWKVSCKMGRDY